MWRAHDVLTIGDVSLTLLPAGHFDRTGQFVATGRRPKVSAPVFAPTDDALAPATARTLPHDDLPRWAWILGLGALLFSLVFAAYVFLSSRWGIVTP